MSEEKKEQKVQCPCGSVVSVKNMGAHQKTKKHTSAVGSSVPPKPERTRGVDFSIAQKQREDDEDDDGDELEDEEGFEDDVLEALEDIEKHLADSSIVQKETHSVVCELRSAINEFKHNLTNLHNLLTSCIEEMRKAPQQPQQPQVRTAKELV